MGIISSLLLSVCLSYSIATTSSNCNAAAVGGTLGTLVIMLVLLLSVTVAGLVYFLMKEFKINCKLRAKSPRAQPVKPAQQRSVVALAISLPEEDLYHAVGLSDLFPSVVNSNGIM